MTKPPRERRPHTYNIIGELTGRNPDRKIMLSAHYDSYFAGFQDDNAAIALMMGIAKAIVDSGYQPEKTLVFSAMAAEEGMNYKQILQHYYTGAKIRTSTTRSGGLFGWLAGLFR